MSIVASTSPTHEPRPLVAYPLSATERTALADACIASPTARTSSQATLVAYTAALASAELPGLEGLRSAIQSLVSDTPPGSVMLISGCPAEVDQAVLALFVCSLLGPVVRYAGEGDFVIAIKDDPTMHSTRPSFADAREFFGHTDLSYVPEPPPFFCLHSVHNDPREGGLSVFCNVDDIVKRLDSETLKVLQEPQYLFPAPSHYAASDGSTTCFPILTQTAEGVWHIRFRRDGLRARSREGILAVVSLLESVNDCSQEVSLEAGTLALISNRTALHGRTAFASSGAAAEGRHINRIYVGTSERTSGATL